MFFAQGAGLHRKDLKIEFNNFIRALAVILLLACFLTDFYERSQLLAINTDFPRLCEWPTNLDQFALFLLPTPIWIMAVNSHSNCRDTCWLRKLLFFWALFLLGICVRGDALLLVWCVSLPLLTVVASHCLKRINWKLFATMQVTPVLAFGSFRYMIDEPGREKQIKTEVALIEAASSMISESVAPTIAPRAPTLGKSDFLTSFGADENKGGMRNTLRIHATEPWQKSPIIEHGPGAFSYFEDSENKQKFPSAGFDMLTQASVVDWRPVFVASGLNASSQSHLFAGNADRSDNFLRSALHPPPARIQSVHDHSRASDQECEKSLNPTKLITRLLHVRYCWVLAP
ncbi:hypothetical protein [Pseudomonas sp. NFX224]|uniref:hypothetical protein n=1 Tax=Pseudomonas sp. NFX224 TaxID=3402862 RepID=UPI003AFAED5F